MNQDPSFSIFSLCLLVFALVLFMTPTVIAFCRGHHYRWIIFVLNTIGAGALGVGWLVALIWAIWPKEKDGTD